MEILLGDEAVALGAIHSGISGSYAYPGTPATEVFEFIENYAKNHVLPIHTFWSTNEKVALEEALGMSYAGKRAIVSMKHVGLNVAADPLLNSALTGVNGGLVIAVADDPGMHSSQNEQDSRYYAQFAQIPCFEPSNQQEAYDMVREAFNLSEKWHIPVMLRLVTRLAHSRSNVRIKEPLPQKDLSLPDDSIGWILLPSIARVQYRKLLEKQPFFRSFSENSAYNYVVLNENYPELGVIVSGIAYNYFREAMGNDDLPSFLHIKFYPLPVGLIAEFMRNFKEILVIEEGYPFIERNISCVLNCKPVRGKDTGDLPLYGELNPELVKKALQKPLPEKIKVEIELPSRLPVLCQGCPHISTFNALNAALKDLRPARVFSDIGCYTLGAYPPYSAIHSCVEMGASIGMALGAAQAGLAYSIAVIGDSTFCHSGITPLLKAARENTPATIIILDNGAVAMTGGQYTMATGDELVNLVAGLGIPKEHIKVINPVPKEEEKNKEVIKEELNYKGVSVIISRRPCIHLAKKRE